MTAAAWVDASNWIRGCWSWKRLYLKLVLIVFFCLIPSGTDEARHTTQPEHWFTGARCMSSFPEPVWIQGHTAACAVVKGVKGCCCRSFQLCCPSYRISGQRQAFTGPAGYPGVLPLPPAGMSPALLSPHPAPLWTGQPVHGEESSSGFWVTQLCNDGQGQETC